MKGVASRIFLGFRHILIGMDQEAVVPEPLACDRTETAAVCPRLDNHCWIDLCLSLFYRKTKVAAKLHMLID